MAISVVVWIAGTAFATQFSNIVDTVASIALVAFGGWIALSGLREVRGGSYGHGHSHGHSHDFLHLDGHHHSTGADDVHGPELQQIETGHGTLKLSIFEDGVPPRFRLTDVEADFIRMETKRSHGVQQTFMMANRGAYWESLQEIPEPHGSDGDRRSWRSRALLPNQVCRARACRQ